MARNTERGTPFAIDDAAACAAGAAECGDSACGGQTAGIQACAVVSIKSTGEVVQPACNMAFFMQKLNDLPVLTHVMRTFDKQSWPEFCAQVYFGMRAADEYVLSVDALEETEAGGGYPALRMDDGSFGANSRLSRGISDRYLMWNLAMRLYNDPNGDFSVPIDLRCPAIMPSRLGWCTASTWIIRNRRLSIAVETMMS